MTSHFEDMIVQTSNCHLPTIRDVCRVGIIQTYTSILIEETRSDRHAVGGINQNRMSTLPARNFHKMASYIINDTYTSVIAYHI